MSLDIKDGADVPAMDDIASLLPRIDRYFPHCWVSAVEAVAKARFGVESFAKVYGFHTFSYRRPEGPIHYRDNGVDLDLEFHRVALPPLGSGVDGSLDLAVSSIYGITTSKRRFTEREAYVRFCEESLKRRQPVITDFDMAYVRSRREYKKVSSPHVIVWTAHDAARRQLIAGEQVCGTVVVEEDDFHECVQAMIASRGAVTVTEVSPSKAAERPLSRAEVIKRIRENLLNLESAQHDKGLRALSLFQDDLQQYVTSCGSGLRSFGVPGLWVFSHERHITRRWLQAVGQLLPEGAAVFLAEFDAILRGLFERWISVDMLIEKCLISGRPRALSAISGHLAALVPMEVEAVRFWKELLLKLENP